MSLRSATQGTLRREWRKGSVGILRLHIPTCASMSTLRSYELEMCDCEVRYTYWPTRRTTDHHRALRKWETQ